MRLRRRPSKLEKARMDADLDLIAADTLPGESAAFDVTVTHRAIIGRWDGTLGKGGKVVWDDGRTFQTGDCDLDRELIKETIRQSIPFPGLEADSPTVISRILGHFRDPDGGGKK